MGAPQSDFGAFTLRFHSDNGWEIPRVAPALIEGDHPRPHTPHANGHGPKYASEWRRENPYEGTLPPPTFALSPDEAHSASTAFPEQRYYTGATPTPFAPEIRGHHLQCLPAHHLSEAESWGTCGLAVTQPGLGPISVQYQHLSDPRYPLTSDMQTASGFAQLEALQLDCHTVAPPPAYPPPALLPFANVSSTLTLEDPPSALNDYSTYQREEAVTSANAVTDNSTHLLKCRLKKGSTRGGRITDRITNSPRHEEHSMAHATLVECGGLFHTPQQFSEHLSRTHDIPKAKGKNDEFSLCAWTNCCMEKPITAGSYHRHILEAHAIHWVCPIEGCEQRTTTRLNWRTQARVRSYPRKASLKTHIEAAHKQDAHAVATLQHLRGHLLAGAVLNPSALVRDSQ
ncbi:hypothetical protein NLJ89_g825 [Agrocybe chaxingu]|uniref:Uncharacterized protein n=1 Tax=Agrocybe chaxingu TaxID=84603 RepID=A0A9W8TFG4_9AGAR|nr:hypothetical protein NLJ89_g825 [Agrocybe chaxingu]